MSNTPPETMRKTPMCFEVTHHLPGHDAPTRTLTDAAGATALLHEAASTGDHLHIRPCAPAKPPAGRAARSGRVH